MEKMEIYEKSRVCPPNALRPILGGKLKGKSDINPVWRIKQLTELFGACGIGWKLCNTKYWTEPGADGEVSAWCSTELKIRVDGEWSDGIEGVGGSMLVELERGKLVTNDEAFKMAYTDALSIACKALGMAADIYFDKDKSSRDNTTKYDKPAPTPEPAPAPAPAPAAPAPAPAEKKPVGIKERWIKALAEKAVNDKGVDAETAYKEKFHPTPEEWALVQDEVYHYKKEHNIQ